jgi:hypothetical protein
VRRLFKGIDRPFELRGESRLIRSVMTNWRLGYFFLSHFKWLSSPSQVQQKIFRRRFITSKVTWNLVDFLTLCQKSAKCAVYTVHFYTWIDFAESHQQHAKSHQLRAMNARGHINSEP